MKSNKAILLVLILAIIGLLLVLRSHFGKPHINLRPSAAVGEVLAQEAARLLDGNGQIALVSRQPPGEVPDANRQRIESFTAALKSHPDLKLATPDWLPRPPAGTMDLGTVSAEQLLAAFNSNPEARVFLILAGLPPFSKEVADKASARSLKLIAVCGYSTNVKRWLESKTLAVAVVPRVGELPAGTPAPKSTRDWFDQEYQLFTPDTLSQLPY